MVRLAQAQDAAQLFDLNDRFNGEGGISIDAIRDSILHNPREVVVVDDRDGRLAGFICIQLKKSFCYGEYMPEITEVYVRPECRMRGIAGDMIRFGEAYCRRNYPLRQFTLLTGQDNLAAQSVYRRLGYEEDGEIHFSKESMP